MEEEFDSTANDHLVNEESNAGTVFPDDQELTDEQPELDEEVTE